MKGDIGLIIWGLKGGHRVFCSNSVVDFIKDDEIKNTITDTRSYSRFNQINLTSYGLEFTRKYKVFTIYRSCYDNGKGGYVAITLYVPHEKKVENIRAALDSMMDAYFKEFVHPGFGTYLRDKYDDIDLFSSYIDRLRVTQETELCKYSPSEQSSNPHVLVYNTDTDVDEYFKSPYRKEFFNCQEVMLLSHDIYDKRPQTLELDSKAIIIDKISEPEFLPQLNVGDNKEVALLEINGTEVEKSKSYQINAATTKIRIIIKRKYCEDYTIIGNVADLIQKGTLKERSNIISLGHYDHLLQYINYKIMFKANGKRVLDNVLYIKEKSPSNGARPRSITNSCVTINGQDLTKDFELYLMPYSQLENKFIKINDKFKPSEYADSNRPFEINLKEYEFNVNVEKSVSDKYFYVYVSKGLRNIKVEIPHVRTTTTIKIFLPVDTDTSDISFDVATKETECSFENGTLTLSSKVLDYELELTSPVMKCVQSWDFIISNKSKKKIAIMGMRYKIKIDSSDDIRKGELTINGDKYKYDVDEENAKIVPYLICVRLDNRTSSEFTYITLWNNKEKTTSQNEIFPYHSKTEVDVKVDEEKYEKTKSSEGFNGLIKIIDIKEKSVYPYNIANRYDFVPRDKKDDEFGDEKVPEKLKLIFSNCNGFCIYRETRNEPFSINKNYYERNLSSDSIQIKDEKQKLLCKIYKDKKKYTYETQEFNENNGFFLEYDYNAGTCTVTYSKPSRSSCEEHEMKKSFKERLKPPYRKRTLLIALLLLLVLIIGGVWAYNYYNSAESIAIGVFEFDNKYGEEIESVKFSEDSEWL
ncbi:MAG: hypothetical protein LUC88_06655, partial [Prevotella sp.]|nr:hypothetical protein [Prevotella sp.]